MKQKVLISGLSLLLTFSLAGCGGQQAQQEPQEPKQEVQQSGAISTEPPAEPLEVKQEVVPTATAVPSEADPAEEVADQQEDLTEAVQLFEDCNETVYATGTVNIRASYTADSEKLGSLNKGDSTTRTGIAIAGTEAEGWSRIQLSDGTTAYISNQYLSTTKPVQQQQNTQSQGNQQTQTSGSQQQTQQTQQTQQSGSTQKIDGHDDLGDYVLNGKGGKYYPALGITLPVSYDGTTTNGAPPQTAEEQELAKEAYEAANRSSEHHTESWSGIKMGG